jgi:adenylyltransferase/sulfurtransferase
MKITKEIFKKYSKQIILKKFGIVGQKKIMSSKVLIVGMGGLGCPLSIYLAGLGVGKIGIVDYDKIELSNLNRQIIYSHKDIGKYKVDVAKKKINEFNTKLKIKSFKKKLNESNIKKIINEFDIICDGTDNFQTRFLINDYCLKEKKILISAAVSGFDGHLFNFNFKKKIPCLRCFMPEIPELDFNCQTEGVTPTITGILGTLQANEVLNTILNNSSNSEKKILIFNSINMNLRKVKLSKNKKCVNRC